MKKVVVLSGAGISQESGIETFRDKQGLWDKFDPKVYASASSWDTMKFEMIEFYDDRRIQLGTVKPNAAHINIVKLEEKYEVVVVTQNVDNLHEQAGSKNVLHLHGELTKIKPETENPYRPKYEDWIDIGYTAMSPKDHIGYRPAVVWFGEAVPMLMNAATELMDANIVIVIGTSLQVYPAAGLLKYAAKPGVKIYLIDPVMPDTQEDLEDVIHIAKKATEGTEELLKILL